MSQLSGMTLGQYRLIEQIGRGGMATVYKAYQGSLDRMVAVKILPAGFAHDAGFLERFRREATAIAKLRHPNILTVYDFGEDNDLTYIVMEYVPGGTLKEWLGQPLPMDWTAEIVRQIADALDYAHSEGIVHRDVKPANVLMARSDWALLSDFGVAKMVEGSAAGLTGAGVGIGTPEYMSPEQGQGGAIDGRSDIYSLGIMLFQMLTGSLPYTADTPLAVVMKHITGPLPIPRTLNPNIPEAVERVILRATAKNPTGRYQTAGEMAQTLRVAVRESATTGIGARQSTPGGQHPGTVVDAQQFEWPAEEEAEKPEPRSSGNMVLVIGGGVIAFLCLLIIASSAAFVVIANNSASTATSTALAWGGMQSPTTRVISPTARPYTPAPTPMSPTKVPTVTMPAVAKGALLFSDEFTNNSASWHTNADESAARSVEGGQYHIVVNKASWLAWGNPGADRRFQDFVLEVTANPVEGPESNGYGVLFRYSDNRNFYSLELSSVGAFRFHKKENDNWVTMTEWIKSGAIKAGNQVNDIRIAAKGNSFSFYANDTPLGTYADDSFVSGNIALFAGTYKEAGVHVTFDELKIWEAK